MTEKLCKACNIRYTLNVSGCYFCDNKLEIVKQKYEKQYFVKFIKERVR